jgi:hypothetical protein
MYRTLAQGKHQQKAMSGFLALAYHQNTLPVHFKSPGSPNRQHSPLKPDEAFFVFLAHMELAFLRVFLIEALLDDEAALS